MMHLPFTFLCGLLTIAAQVEVPPVAPGSTPVSTLTIVATLPDGSPAGDVSVYNVELSTGDPGSGALGVTDATGKFTITFRAGEQTDPKYGPGYEVFRYVLMPTGFRWEVSDIYCWKHNPRVELPPRKDGGYYYEFDRWFEPGFQGKLDTDDPADNWSYGKGIPVHPGTELTWSISLQPGESTDVSVVDQFGAPVANAEIQLGIDLRARTRTGYGAQIVQQVVQTDGQGHFRLAHVGDYAYQFDVKGQPFYRPDYWCLVSEVDHNLKKQGPVVRFQRAVSHHLSFLALDAKTRLPIAGASLFVEEQFPAFTQGGPLGVQTDESGLVKYDAPIELEHCVWFALKAQGYADGVFKMEKYIPGEPIRITMEPKVTPELPKQKQAQPPEFPD